MKKLTKMLIDSKTYLGLTGKDHNRSTDQLKNKVLALRNNFINYIVHPLVGTFNNGMCDHASKSVVRRGPGVCMTQETGLSFANIVLKLNVITCTVVLTVYVF